MANDLINGEGAGKPAPKAADTSVWMYRGQEARLFRSAADVPADEDWRDAPYEVSETVSETEKPKRRKKPEADQVEDVPDGDSN